MSAQKTAKEARYRELKLSMEVFFSNKSAVAGLVIFLFYFFDAIILQFFPQVMPFKHPYSLTPNYVNPIPLPPSKKFPFGTTYPGVNLLTAIIKSIRLDFWLSLAVVVPGAFLGVIIGIVATYFGGLVDEVLMRITDIVFSIPYLVLAIAIGYVLGRTLNSMMIALILVWWPLYARYARSITLEVKEITFIEAARAAGSSKMKIMFRHILPNSLPPVFVQMSLDLGTIMLAISALAFIGFLPAANLPELGYLTSLGYNYVETAPWAMIIPGMFIVLFALAVNLMGDGFRDVIDPRRRSAL